MRFRYEDLPPAVQAQFDLQENIQKEKQNKYHAIKTQIDNIKFPSLKEANRYAELMLEQKAGLIFDLRLQVNFTLQEGYTTSTGKRVRPIVYKADFTYWRNEQYIVEDAKSSPTKTKTYIIKRKLLQDKFGITITEV